MKQASDYLAYVKAMIILNPRVIQWITLREEAQEQIGLFRYRLTLDDGSLLEAFERFQITEQGVTVTKYSFHWQDTVGRLIRRWDNAAHHSEIETYPHHVHEGDEVTVSTAKTMNIEKVLGLIAVGER